MKKSLFFLLFPLIINAQNYAVSNIPKELLENASAVIRNNKIMFMVEDKGNATETTSFAVTVFNDAAAERFATLRIPYNKLSKIRKIEGQIFDAGGKEIQKIKSSDIQDIGLGAFENDISDNRVKVVSFDKKNLPLPYTIAYSYEETSKNLMFYPSWTTGVSESVAVEQSSLLITVPDNVSFRHIEKEFNELVKKTITRNGKTILWEVRNLPAQTQEPFSKKEPSPTVIAAPDDFEVQGIEGSFKTWSDFAKFYLKLNEGRNTLTETTKTKVRELTQNLTTTEEKARAVYSYLQSTTHYLNISLGIGGWQTIPAEKVAEKGYGDCKALTNYYNAMLEAAGVKAYGALVYAGKTSIDLEDNFPVSSFNHIISCVPTPTDTLWMECTSQTNPFGYQGDFTGNRRVLLVKPESGELVNTVHYKPENNLQIRKATVKIDENGDATANVTTIYTALQQEEIRAAMESLNSDEQRRWLLNRIEIGNFELNKFTFKKQDGKIPEVTEKLELSVKKIASKSGKRMFIKPNLMTTFFSTPPATENRKSELYLNEITYNFVDTDTIIYELPEGYVVEYLPQATTFAETFGSYTASVEILGNKLIYQRTARMKGGTYSADTYQKFTEFIKNVNKTDRMRVVFVEKKT